MGNYEEQLKWELIRINAETMGMTIEEYIEYKIAKKAKEAEKNKK